jgi:hypothetical protein
MKYPTALLLLGLAATSFTVRAESVDLTKLPPPATRAGVTFDKDIKPLFEASCVQCHGAQKPKGLLRLDTLQGVLKGGEEGKVLVPGDSAKSKLVVAVSGLNPKFMMPPKPREGRAPAGGQQRPPAKPLTAEEVGLVRAWIDQGAK